MKTLILAIALLFSPVTGSAPQNDQIVGSWRLLSFTRTVVATGETFDTFGKAPSGFLHFAPDGRMMLLIVSQVRPNPADPEKMTDQERAKLFGTMLAFAGTYTFDGKTFTSHLDVTWNQAWTGTDIVRHVTFEGRRMVLTTDPHQSYIDGKVITAVMNFEKVQ